eukprot:1147310-Pelagomonas_calceolata.AAC.3
MDPIITAWPHHLTGQTCSLLHALQNPTMRSHLLPHIVQSAQLSRHSEFVLAAQGDTQPIIVNFFNPYVKEQVAKVGSPNGTPCASRIDFSFSMPKLGEIPDPHPSLLDPPGYALDEMLNHCCRSGLSTDSWPPTLGPPWLKLGMQGLNAHRVRSCMLRSERDRCFIISNMHAQPD